MVDDATVWTGVALPGYHCWPEAPDHRAYLRARHRHLFHILVEAVVGHDDRDVEFHDLQDAIRAWWTADITDRGTWSCEKFARVLGLELRSQGFPVIAVDVSEDGESGATVRFAP